MQAINILEPTEIKPKHPATLQVSQSGAYSHAGDDECPVCKKPMRVAKIKLESVYFCPEHRITFPMREPTE